MEELISGDIKLQKGAISILSPTGVKVVPQHIDVGKVSYVYDLGQSGWAKPILDGGQEVNRAVAAITNINMNWVADTGYVFNTFSPLLNLNEENFRIIAAHAQLQFDAAGAIAFNGKIVEKRWQIRHQSLNQNNILINQRLTVATGTLTYLFPLYGLSDGNGLGFPLAVPSGSALISTLSALDGTAFPANTLLTLHLIGLRTKINVAVPL